MLSPPENLLNVFFDIDTSNWCEWTYLADLDLIAGTYKPLVRDDEKPG